MIATYLMVTIFPHFGHLISTWRITTDAFAEYGQIIDDLPYWEYAHDTLIHGSSDEKRECIAAFKNFPLIKRNMLFKPDFNYREWLREITKSEEQFEPSNRIKIHFTSTEENNFEMVST